MNTRQIDIFVNVVRYGNFSNAAKKLYLSQPAVSSSVDALEKELGVKLFLRQSKKVVLTEKGEDFYKDSLNILNLTEKTMKNMAEDKGLNGVIRVAANYYAGIYYIPQHLVDFRRAHPNVYFDLYIGGSDKIVRQVLDGRFDIGIIGKPIDQSSLRQKRVLSDKLVFTCLNAPPLAGLPRVMSQNELFDVPFITRTLDEEQITIFESALYDVGRSLLELNVVAEMNSNEAVLAAVYAGLGMAVLPHTCVGKYPDLREIEVEGFNMCRNHYAITPSDEYSSLRVCQFYDFLRHQ
ncbi:MAG: LysR family transcriptional regulator [Peptococcaceae bacterium]|jgi:DNA-binding transcriptional LysR family regulator|nr:LysR family transcriptional regulator [Peptococcaceae bacterium]